MRVTLWRGDDSESFEGVNVGARFERPVVYRGAAGYFVRVYRPTQFHDGLDHIEAVYERLERVSSLQTVFDPARLPV